MSKGTEINKNSFLKNLKSFLAFAPYYLLIYSTKICYSSCMSYKLNGRNIYEMNTLSMNGRGYIMLTELQKKFFLKLKIPPKENVEFEDLHTILL